MKLSRIISEKEEFSYNVEAKNMWREALKEAQKKFKIAFDQENNESKGEFKIIKIGQDNKFKCELFAAAGDWEHPVNYFRCELCDGYANGISKYSNPHFCYIPGKDDGNGHLIRTKNGYSAPDDSDADESLIDDKKCWASLEKYLKTLIS